MWLPCLSSGARPIRRSDDDVRCGRRPPLALGVGHRPFGLVRNLRKRESLRSALPKAQALGDRIRPMVHARAEGDARRSSRRTESRRARVGPYVNRLPDARRPDTMGDHRSAPDVRNCGTSKSPRRRRCVRDARDGPGALGSSPARYSRPSGPSVTANRGADLPHRAGVSLASMSEAGRGRANQAPGGITYTRAWSRSRPVPNGCGVGGR